MNVYQRWWLRLPLFVRRVCFTNDNDEDDQPAHYDVGCPFLLHDRLADHLCYTCAEYVLQMILTKMINPPITLAMSVAPRGSRVWQPPAAWIMYCSFNHLTVSNRV